MQPISILGHKVEVELRIAPARASAMAGLDLAAALAEMANRIDAVDWRPDQAEALRSMRRIVLFEPRVQANGWRISRSGCDEADGVFYWRLAEFVAHPDPAVHANIFFHDCWHVVQHRRDGGYAWDPAEQVRRELEALERQIEAARMLGCEAGKVLFLEAFRDSPARIAARLRQGVRRARKRPRRS